MPENCYDAPVIAMRDFNDGFQHLSVEDQVRYRTQSQHSWVVSHLGFGFGIMIVPLLFLLLGDLPPQIGAIIFSAAIVLALGLVVSFVVKARRGDFRTPSPPRQRYLDAADLNPDARRQAMRKFRFRR
jgi:hypothetical protein